MVVDEIKFVSRFKNPRYMQAFPNLGFQGRILFIAPGTYCPELSPGKRIPRSEQGNIQPELDQLFGEKGNYPFPGP